MVKQPEWIRTAIAIGNQFHYRKKNSYLHNALNLTLLVMLVGGVVGVAASAAIVPHTLYIPLAALAFGLLYFTIIILVNHEACHGMLIVAKDRGTAQFWNRFFGWSVCLFFAMHFYEDWEKGHHQEHHLRPIENDGAIYKHLALGSDLVIRCAKILFIPGYLFVLEKRLPQEDQRKLEGSRGFLMPATACLWIVVGTLATLTVSWVVPVAAFLGLHVASVFHQLKLSLEHGGKIGKEENRYFRSRTSLFPFRWLLMPLNISLHFEHHLNYCVPWYDLPRYQRALREVVPAHLQPYVFNQDVWDQLAGRKDVGVPSNDTLNPTYITTRLISLPSSTPRAVRPD